MLETRVLTTIDLIGDCAEAGCLKMAWERKQQLAVPTYSDGVSLLAVPDSLEEWRSEHRTARKRSDRSARLGYSFGEISRQRSKWTDDVLRINLSLPTRQGRPMSAGYHAPSFSDLPTYACPNHAIHTYGIMWGFHRLVAYLTLYRVGQLAMVSMILGHGDHLKNDIMFNLFAGVVKDQAGMGGSFYYNRDDSGTDGLRYFKRKLGFRSGDVAWSM